MTSALKEGGRGGTKKADESKGGCVIVVATTQCHILAYCCSKGMIRLED